MRRVTIPDPTTKNSRGETWGLVEWILESFSKVVDTTEGCDLVALVAPQLMPLKGEAQRGRTFDVTEGQLEKIRDCCRPTQTIGVDQILAVSGYLKALHTAAIVEEKKPEEKKPEEKKPEEKKSVEKKFVETDEWPQ